jgi:hypothetical protein
MITDLLTRRSRLALPPVRRVAALEPAQDRAGERLQEEGSG